MRRVSVVIGRDDDEFQICYVRRYLEHDGSLFRVGCLRKIALYQVTLDIHELPRLQDAIERSRGAGVRASGVCRVRGVRIRIPHI